MPRWPHRKPEAPRPVPQAFLRPFSPTTCLQPSLDVPVVLLQLVLRPLSPVVQFRPSSQPAQSSHQPPTANRNDHQTKIPSFTWKTRYSTFLGRNHFTKQKHTIKLALLLAAATLEDLQLFSPWLVFSQEWITMCV